MRWLYLGAGWLCLLIGAIGVVLPVLPTTPLVLLAAWCFSRGSERMHRWLMAHSIFGPLVRDWERYRVIPLRAKLVATSMMTLVTAYLHFGSTAPGWARVLATVLVLWGLVFIWTKPSRRPGEGLAEVSSRAATND